MAISFVEAGTYFESNASNDTVYPMNRPANAQAGDLLVGFASCVRTTNTPTITDLNGWTQVGSTLNSAENPGIGAVIVVTRVAAADDPASWDITLSETRFRRQTQVLAYRGCKSTLLASSGAVTDTDGTGATTPSVSNTNPGAWSIAAFAARATSNMSAMTSSESALRLWDNSGTGGENCQLGIFDSNGTIATGSTSRTGTFAATVASHTAWIGILEPSGDGVHFGNTGDSSGSQSLATGRKAVSSISSGAASGTLDTVTARAWKADGTFIAKAVVYADSSGSPGALLATSDELSVAAGAETGKAFTFSGAERISITSSTTYWVGLIFGHATGNVTMSIGATGSALKWNTDTYSDGASNPFGSVSNLTGPLDVFATVLASSGASASAGQAAASATANASGVIVSPNAGHASATSTSYGSTAFVGENAGHVPVQGVTGVPVPSVKVFPDNAGYFEEDLVRYAQTIGNGSATSFSVTHNFGSRDVVASVYDAATYEVVLPTSIVHTDTNTVTVSFPSAPTTNEYRVVVLFSSLE